MLVLKRKEGTTIYVGDDISITIVESRSPVKVGIDAPKDVRIVRDDAVNGAGPAPESPDRDETLPGATLNLSELMDELQAIERSYGAPVKPMIDMIRARAISLCRHSG